MWSSWIRRSTQFFNGHLGPLADFVFYLGETVIYIMLVGYQTKQKYGRAQCNLRYEWDHHFGHFLILLRVTLTPIEASYRICVSVASGFSSHSWPENVTLQTGLGIPSIMCGVRKGVSEPLGKQRNLGFGAEGR